MRIFLTALLAFTLLLVAGLVSRLNTIGVFDEVPDPYQKACHLLPNIPGPEDIELNYNSGIAYVSSDDRRSHAINPDEQGAIYRLLTASELSDVVTAQKMTGTESLIDFHPHGISLYAEGDTEYLFVISHKTPELPAAGHDIYVFAINGNNLEEHNRFSHDSFRSPNDLAATSLSSFYFTNDRINLEGPAMMAEILFAGSGSDVSYFDGIHSKVVAPDLQFANGILLSKDTKTLLVSESNGAKVRVFSRNGTTNDLLERSIIPVGNAPDNISEDADGQFWVTDHVNTLANAAYGEDPTEKSPVRIYTLDLEGQSANLEYQDDGTYFSSVSVAIPFKNQLILGSIFQSGVTICQR